MTDIQTFIDLTRQAKAAKAALTDVNKALAVVAARIMEDWEKNGTQLSKDTDGVTVYVSRWLSAKVTDKAKLREYMERHGLTELLTVNARTLSAWLKEEPLHVDAIDDWNAGNLPDELRACLDVGEFHKLNVRGVS